MSKGPDRRGHGAIYTTVQSDYEQVSLSGLEDHLYALSAIHISRKLVKGQQWPTFRIC